jgi:hypothetical protein
MESMRGEEGVLRADEAHEYATGELLERKRRRRRRGSGEQELVDLPLPMLRLSSPAVSTEYAYLHFS